MAMIQKWGAVNRLSHWLLTIGVTISIITGLPLFAPSIFGFLAPLRGVVLSLGFLDLTIHFVAALFIMVAALIHVLYRLVSSKSTSAWFGWKDLREFGTIAKHWFGATKDYPRLGYHHPGQKAVYWLAAIIGLILTGVSGLILMFPGVIIAESWTTATILVHDLGFVLMSVIITGHFILAVTRRNWPVLKAMMVSGKVPISWANRSYKDQDRSRSKNLENLDLATFLI
jgi:cytochrome b subunit of formate dehydrogenase